MRKGPESIEEPSFKVDTDVSEVDEGPERRDEEYLQTEAEGYAAITPKSRASTNGIYKAFYRNNVMGFIRK